MPIFSIFDDSQEANKHLAEPLDGDFNKVFPLGFDYHPVAKVARLADGSLVHKQSRYQGLPVDTAHLPTRVKVCGPRRKLPDILMSRSKLLVSIEFRKTVELIEDNIHQFAAAELIWDDGTHAANFFWLYPGTRLDAMDEHASSHERSAKSGHWLVRQGGQFLANQKQVGPHHLWIDPRMPTFAYPFVSETFRYAADKAGLRGIGYNEIPFSD